MAGPLCKSNQAKPASPVRDNYLYVQKIVHIFVVKKMYHGYDYYHRF